MWIQDPDSGEWVDDGQPDDPYAGGGATDWWDDAKVQEWYRTILGRGPNESIEGYQNHRNAGSMEEVRRILEASPEAQAFRDRQAPGGSVNLPPPTPPIGDSRGEDVFKPYRAYMAEATRLHPERAAEIAALEQWDPNSDAPIPDAANLIPGLRDQFASIRDVGQQQRIGDYRAEATRRGFHAPEDDASILSSPGYLQGNPDLIGGERITDRAGRGINPSGWEQAYAPYQPGGTAWNGVNNAAMDGDTFSFDPYNPGAVDQDDWQAPASTVGAFKGDIYAGAATPPPTAQTARFAPPAGLPALGGAAAPAVQNRRFTPEEFGVGPYKEAAPFAYEDFQGPTAENFTADPGYEFARKEGLRAMENAASSEGLLRSSGTLKGMMEYGTGLASQEFGNVYNRARDTWQANRGNAAENYDRNEGNRRGAYDVNYRGATDQFGREVTGWEADRATDKDMYDQWLSGQGNTRANRSQLFGEAATTSEIGRAEDQDAYSRWLGTAQENRAGQAQQFGQGIAGWQANYGRDQDAIKNSLTGWMTNYGKKADDWNRGLTTHQTNFGNTATGFGINQGVKQNKFGNLLSLYDLSTRNLPKYEPTAMNYAI